MRSKLVKWPKSLNKHEKRNSRITKIEHAVTCVFRALCQNKMLSYDTRLIIASTEQKSGQFSLCVSNYRNYKSDL